MIEKTGKARRGDALRQHILLTARDTFLELGFERTSMDVVAARAGTSKRSLYAHFDSKEKLFNTFLDLRREMFLGKMKTPGNYSKKPADALVMFCARYLEITVFDKSIRLCRISVAEADRFPQGAAHCFDVAFTETEAIVSEYLRTTLGMKPRAAREAATRLLGQVLYPRFARALFGMDPLAGTYDPDKLPPWLDLKPIRRAVAEVLGAVPRTK